MPEQKYDRAVIRSLVKDLKENHKIVLQCKKTPFIMRASALFIAYCHPLFYIDIQKYSSSDREMSIGNKEMENGLKKIKFSIVTVCLNAESTILETIRSVKQQKYPNYEYVMMDGLSRIIH